MITITFNVELFAVIIMAILLLYMVAILISNTYVNLSPKAMGRLSVVWYLLGVLTVSFIVDDALFIYFAGAIVVVFVILTILKIRKNNKGNKKTAQMQGGNNT